MRYMSTPSWMTRPTVIMSATILKEMVEKSKSEPHQYTTVKMPAARVTSVCYRCMSNPDGGCRDCG